MLKFAIAETKRNQTYDRNTLLDMLIKLGNNYLQTNKYQEAINSLTECLEISDTLNGKKHLKNGEILTSLGIACNKFDQS
jgi:hypothetical protein